MALAVFNAEEWVEGGGMTVKEKQRTVCEYGCDWLLTFIQSVVEMGHSDRSTLVPDSVLGKSL